MQLDWVQRGEKKLGRDPDRLEPEEYKLKQEREKLDKQREAEIADAIERKKMEEKTAKLAETARKALMDTAKAKAAEAEKRAVEAEERVRVADDALATLKAAQRDAQEAADTILAKAQEEAANIVLRANESAEADVRAITHSMLKDDGKAFMELTEENRMLHKAVSRQGAIIELLQDTLKRLLPDDLRKRIKNTFDAVWVKHPDNPTKPKSDPPQGYTTPGNSL